MKQTMNRQRRMIIISGPTAAGKSDLACELATIIGGEIVNADMGQLYGPLSIGTAKPDLQNQTVPHHLFGIIDTPRDCTVIEYRSLILPTLESIWASGAIPIVVGGSGFYLQSLFFPPAVRSASSHVPEKQEDPDWDLLYSIDPERAKHIHPNDAYRICRALHIWKTTGKKPSTFSCAYEPICSTCFLWVTRDKKELDKRINERVITMLDQGWLKECKNLMGTPWEHFVGEKKIIGYRELFQCLKARDNLKDNDLDGVIALIQQKTRSYAKRQTTFWGMLKRKLVPLESCEPFVVTRELNLTLDDPRLYINHLVRSLDFCEQRAT